MQKKGFMKKILKVCLFFGLCSGALAEEIKIGGFMHTQFFTGKAENNSFTVKRARVKLTGKIMSGTPSLLDAFVEYKLSEKLKIKTGQFKIHVRDAVSS